MFGMVVLFGVYHGIIFVPVLLSFFGPIHHRSLEPEPDQDLNPVQNPDLNGTGKSGKDRTENGVTKF